MSRVPSEFRYFHPERARVVKRIRAVGKAIGFDPALPDDVVRAFAEMYFDADPVAEAFVADTYLRHGKAYGRALLERALEGGIEAVQDAPPSLAKLFAELERDPPWLDWAKVEHGARVFRRWGSDAFRFAGALTLNAYAESSVAKPLALTGAYAGASAKRRLMETVAFWIAVSEPGGLRPGAPGWASAIRVRVMHVFVRQRLLSHPEWDADAWGVPISQGDALLTLMGGSIAPGIGLRALGYRPSKEDVEATMHFWRYVGHLMGVSPQWYPERVSDALRLAFVSWAKSSGRAGEDGVKLCQSFARAFEPDPKAPLAERVRQAIEHRVHLGYTRFFLSRAVYRANRMPSAGPWALLPMVRFPFVFAAETLRRALPALDEFADRRARAERARWYAHHSHHAHPSRAGARKAEYDPVTTFTR